MKMQSEKLKKRKKEKKKQQVLILIQMPMTKKDNLNLLKWWNKDSLMEKIQISVWQL